MTDSGSTDRPSRKSKKLAPCGKKSKLERKGTKVFPERNIIANEERKDFPNNKISTGKYNVATFLPKNLYYQFSKMANVYFLVIGALSFIKEISTTDGVPIIWAPLALIVAISALKDIVEDAKRHASDREENNKKTMVLIDGQFVQKRWRDVRVGNIIKVVEDEFIPADILLLNSSDSKGAAYIETKSLDGETNLKFKKVHKDLFESYKDENNLQKADFHFKYEGPNVYLYKFNGSVRVADGNEIPLGDQNFILRGSSLRNTESITGLVAYTGHHTKIMMNSIKAKAKFSKLERTMNSLIIRIFVFQLLFCLLCGLIAAIWYAANQDGLDYLVIDSNKAKDHNFGYNWFVRFGNWILLFTNFVPISLLVTLEMVKLIQGILMTNDPEMISYPDKMKPSVQSSNLNEELGQIEYIFSDKTGTLTKNIMEFKMLSVNGRAYGEKRDLKDEVLQKRPKVTNVDFMDQSLFDVLYSSGNKENEELREVLEMLGVCHTIITQEKNGELIYNAASPDELALVNLAKFIGAEFKGYDEQENMLLQFIDEQCNPKQYKYKILDVLEFNSTRKRMSVILEREDGKIVLYCKGADSIIAARMSKQDIQSKEWTNTVELLEKYASVGLRTLVLAKKELTQQEYDAWKSEYRKAEVLTEGRDQAMMDIQEKIEVDLKLLGSTAIEDKLQDEVGETIFRLKEAGIKVWVLTGDKVETAINIGYACKLLNDDMDQYHITAEDKEGVNADLDKAIAELDKNYDPEKSNNAMVITGQALIHAAKGELPKKVMSIGDRCKVVIACRVSPKQKQEVVSMVRAAKPKVTTLAIGDGANDVNMIIAAHVGVGIKGLEGQQAARASDFAVGEFRILRRLTLYYGREAYRRNAYLILYNFYKNMIIVVPQFWFGTLSGFSGTTIYDQIIYQGFNVFYAALPIIVYAVFDQEHEPKKLLTRPEYYKQGIYDKIFNQKNFIGWFVQGFLEAAIILYFAFYIMDEDFSTPGASDGRHFGILGPGMLVHSIAVWVVNFKIILMSNTFNFLNLFCIFGSILVYVLIYYIGNLFKSLEIFGLFDETWRNPAFWATKALVLFIIYFYTSAYLKYFYLRDETIYNKTSPEEQEAQRIVDSTPKPEIEIKKGPDSTHKEHEVQPNGATDNESKHHFAREEKHRHTGFAFNALEKHPDKFKINMEN